MPRELGLAALYERDAGSCVRPEAHEVGTTVISHAARTHSEIHTASVQEHRKRKSMLKQRNPSVTRGAPIFSAQHASRAAIRSPDAASHEQQRAARSEAQQRAPEAASHAAPHAQQRPTRLHHSSIFDLRSPLRRPCVCHHWLYSALRLSADCARVQTDARRVHPACCECTQARRSSVYDENHEVGEPRAMGIGDGRGTADIKVVSCSCRVW